MSANRSNRPKFPGFKLRAHKRHIRVMYHKETANDEPVLDFNFATLLTNRLDGVEQTAKVHHENADAIADAVRRSKGKIRYNMTALTLTTSLNMLAALSASLHGIGYTPEQIQLVVNHGIGLLPLNSLKEVVVE